MHGSRRRATWSPCRTSATALSCPRAADSSNQPEKPLCTPGCLTAPRPRVCLRSFVSDQYHESLPFRFAPGYENRRVNLTLLFGDRWSQRLGAAAEPAHERERGGSVAAVADPAGDGWDVFG